MKTLIKKIFKDSWFFVWNNPLLWIFGIFAGFFINSEFNLLFSSFQSKELYFLTYIRNFNFSFWPILNTLIVIILILIIIYLAIISEISIIYSFRLDKKIGFKALFKKSHQYLWQTLLVNSIFFSVLYLPALGIYSLIHFHWYISNIFLKFLFFLFLLILIICVLILNRYTLIHIILRKEGILSAFYKGYSFCKKNGLMLINILFWLFILSIIISVFLALSLITTSLPFFFLLFLSYQLNLIIVWWLIFIIWLISLFIITIFTSSLFSCFQISTWIIYFLKYTK